MALSGNKKSAGGKGGFAEINVTPMVDVMLVLLIVFMVAAPLLATSGLTINLPEVTASNTPIKDSKLVISITKDERIHFGVDEKGEPIDVTATVEQTLKDNLRVQTEKEVYIRADQEAHYGTVARAVAAARAAGVVSLNLMVEPEVED